MSLAIITGSTGLVGSESVNFFHDKGFDVIGIDNNLRKFFFGDSGSTNWIKSKLLKRNKRFKNYSIDIRNHNRRAIKCHPMAHKITMIEGSSIEQSTFERVEKLVPKGSKVLVMLDSNHTEEHVLKELNHSYNVLLLLLDM